MTHMSPTSIMFCAIICVIAAMYFLWHSWSFDRFQSLVPTRRKAFKCAMTWSILICQACFIIWSVGMAYIKYQVGYTPIRNIGVIPTPYGLWPDSYKAVTPILYYLLVAAWTMLLSVHIEETCFWIHLARSIRGLTEKTWLASGWFKLWLLGTSLGIVVMFGVIAPFDQDPQQMETNAFFAGTILSSFFTLTSLYIIFGFPALIDTVRSQGGSQIVLSRLQYHRRLTKYRMVGRVVFIIPFLAISADGLTPHHDIANHESLTDLFLIIGLLGLFSSTIISVFMFFPPSDTPATSSRLLPPVPPTMPQPFDHDASTRPLPPSKSQSPSPHNLSISSFSSFEHLKPAPVVVIGVRPPTRTGGRDYTEMSALEREQVKTNISVVAPFATPPATPSLAFPTAPRVATQEGNRADQTSSQQQGSAYAWSMLAEHLRLPEESLGMVGAAAMAEVRGARLSSIEEGRGRSGEGRERSSREAAAVVQREAIHPALQSISATPKYVPMGDPLQSTHQHTRLHSNPEPALDTKLPSIDLPRSLPPPLRSPPKPSALVGAVNPFLNSAAGGVGARPQSREVIVDDVPRSATMPVENDAEMDIILGYGRQSLGSRRLA